MDIVNLDGTIQFSTTCNCYKVSSLTKTVLDSTEISNFKDQYVLGEQLGLGQFGVIRTCTDKLTGEVLACKSIATDRLVTENDVRNVKLEIEIMSKLSGHPNVVNLKAVYEEDDYVHLLMELCAGGELFHRLEKYGRFSEHDARFIFRHLMQVVQYCHENGIVHRDLKPENILLSTNSSSSPIKLADFGLATYIKPGQYLHGTVGSPFYIAPEVLAGGYNQSADVWSAGVILYILLSGMPPFWGNTKSRIFDAVRAADLRFPPDPWNQISASAKELIAGMLRVDSSTRLNASQVLAHSWMQDCVQGAQESYNLDNLNCGKLDLGGASFCNPLIKRDGDYSFSSATPISIVGQKEGTSPLLTSFSSFLVDNNSPCSSPGGFSFSNCGEESGTVEFSSTVPSFTFFSPSSIAPKGVVLFEFEAATELNTRKLAAKHGAGEMKQKTDGRREGFNGSRVSSIHSRRNHTIGLGEFDQLNIIVTDSIIRWASCTNIPTAPSLRLSLVC